jgi:RNA polymerase sigma-70 factor (ECF subfamily)
MTFEELYHAQFPFVWRLLHRLGVPAADLPDVMQEVFLTVHRRLPDFVQRANVRAWLFRISTRAARDQRRKTHVRHEHASSDVLELEATRAPDAHEMLVRREEESLLAAALGDMDLEQRMVFVAFELEGLSGQEIASALQIPSGTVHSRLRLGREAFRKSLKRNALRAGIVAGNR